MENTVKYEDWINKETFEVKQLPIGYGLWGSKWVKIPDDAEFAVSNGEGFEFRKGDSWWSSCADQWVVGNWNKSDYPKNDYHIVWERKTTEEVKEQPLPNKHSDEFIEQRTKIFSKYLQGVKFQYRYNGVGQWRDLKDKSLWYLTNRSVEFREKPYKITIDGVEMDKEAAIKYIEKHY